MLFKIFGCWSREDCRRVCIEVEEVISREHGRRAMSLAFLDLDSPKGRQEAARRRLRGGAPEGVATEEGREVARWDERVSVRAFLRTLLRSGGDRA